MTADVPQYKLNAKKHMKRIKSALKRSGIHTCFVAGSMDVYGLIKYIGAWNRDYRSEKWSKRYPFDIHVLAKMGTKMEKKREVTGVHFTFWVGSTRTS